MTEHETGPELGPETGDLHPEVPTEDALEQRRPAAEAGEGVELTEELMDLDTTAAEADPADRAEQLRPVGGEQDEDDYR